MSSYPRIVISICNNSKCSIIFQVFINFFGLFDEKFVMFGHDIDLSYRLRLAGYKNYYFPKTYIINFKGGNAPQFNWQYIKHFYGAMIIFAMKYLFKMPELKLQGNPKLPLAYEVER